MSRSSWPRLLGCLTVLLSATAVSLPVLSQAYPTKPIRFVVPFAPGGGSDLFARLIAAGLTDGLGERVIVDNRPAVDGIVGTEIVARAAADGHTLLIVNNSHAINPALGKKLPYESIRDFAPISQILNQQMLLVVHPTLPVKTVKELVDHLKARPGKLNYGSSSNAAALPMELFKNMTGTDVQRVPYKGSAPMAIDLVGGQLQLSMAGTVTMMPYIKAGRLRALGIGDLKRSAILPDVPTIAEAGVPGYHAVLWFGMLAPARTPRPILERLNKEVVRILQAPDFREKASALGTDIVGSTSAEWGKFLASEVEKWTKIVQISGFTSD